MGKNALQIDYCKIAALKPYVNSPRIHSQGQRRKLVSLLRKFGQVAPVIIDLDLVVVDGHAVVDALKELGYDEVATVVVADRSPEEIRAIRLALNRIPQEASWDQQKLRVEFLELIDLSFDVEFTAFDQVEIDMTLSIDDPSSGEVDDVPAVPSLDGPSVSRKGDTWTLGGHRLLCGDAQDEPAIQNIFDGAEARMMFADPPYNIAIDGNVSGLGHTKHRAFPMFCGEESDEEYDAFLVKFLQTATKVMRDGAIGFVCIDWRHIENLIAAGKNADLTLKNIIAWVKTNAGMGAFYRSQHEFIPIFKWGDKPHLNNFGLGKHGRSRSNVWTYPGMNVFGAERDALLSEHPTVKPVSLVKDAIKDVSRRNEIVFDPFLGSGTTLIAAEEIGRRCFGIELDPLYVDLSVRRWQDATGRQAVLSSIGVPFDEIELLRKSDVPLLPAPSSCEREG